MPLALAASLWLQARELPAAPDRQDIVVTGERAERRVRDTPSSVAVFRFDTIEGLAGADRLDDLLPLVPNVQLGDGSQAPAIRGQDGTGVLRDLPAFLGGNRPRVALQIDGRPVDYNELVFGIASLWDVEQVELYRSPQSTTQGVNSIAGAIFVSTNDPEPDWAGRARIGVGSRERRQASLMVTGPLVADQLAFRVAADWTRQRPTSRIADLIRGAAPDIDKQAVARFKLLATPNALPSGRFEFGYTHSTSQAPQVERVRRPFEQRRDPTPGYGLFHTNVDAVTGEGHIRLREKLQSTTTVTASWSDIQRFAPPGLGEARNRRRQLSAETLLRWRSGEAFKLQGGLNLLASDLDQQIDLRALGVGLGRFRDRQVGLGLFGEAEWQPLARLTLTAGVRRQHDEQRRDGSLVSGPNVTPLNLRERFQQWLPKISASYRLGEAATVGLLVQKAANPGGATLNLLGFVDRFAAEQLWDAEIFARGRVGGGRVGYSLNLFRNRFDNAQRLQIEQVVLPNGLSLPLSLLGNAPRARSRGLEAQIDWRVTNRLKAGAGLGLLDTRVTRTGLATDPLLGKQFARSPHRSASASVDWRPVDRLRLSAQLHGHSGYFSDDPNNPALRIGGAMFADARAAFDFGRFTASAYVRNIADRFALVRYFDTQSATAEAPRELGFDLEARF